MQSFAFPQSERQTEADQLISPAQLPCLNYFADIDGDGFGNFQSSLNSCTGTPTGYVLDSSDCDDEDGGVHVSIGAYIDADGDGFGTGNILTICSPDINAPPGYSVNNTDCNDQLAAINPTHNEVLYNGIDDNCNGILDEGNQIFTQVQASQCGSTLSSLGSLIACTSTNLVTAYKFHVTNVGTGSVEIIIRPLHYFSLPMLASYNYGTTYSIKVELQRYGIWLGYYGPSCLVTSPDIFNSSGAQIIAEQCGITLPSLGTLITTTSIAGISTYRFRVTNITDPNAPNQVQVLERTLQWFSLLMLHNYNYGTTYLVEVSIKSYGIYTGYGSACTVTAPPVPMLTNCGAIIPSPTTLIPTSSLAYVTSYRFEITNESTGVVTTVDQPLNSFRFLNVPNFSPGVVHYVRVAIMTAGVYSLYGDACEITSPGVARSETPKGETISKTAFTVVAYPNPFAAGFKLDIKTSSEEKFNIKVYDMTGRLLEARSTEMPEIDSQQIGDNYSAGVYSVIVNQGENNKTLRVIKR